MPPAIRNLNVDQSKLEGLCREYHVKRLAVFGSYLRGDEKPTSDLDLLVEFEPQARIGLFKFVHFEQRLGEVFGKKVDLNSAGFLNKAFREEVISHAQPIYAG
jgi:predicted nucleotidyltransferase